MNLSQISLLMAGTAGICLFLAAHAWARRKQPEALSLALFLLSAALWSFFYAMEFTLHDPSHVRAVMVPEYVGIATCPVHFLLFAARYSGNDAWLTRSRLILLFAVPTITVAMVATNGLHHLYYSSLEVALLEGHSVVILENGPFWHVHVVYSYMLIFAALALMTRMYFSVSAANRTRVGHVLLAALLPVGVALAYILGFRPYGFLDLTPAAFAATGIILAAGILTLDLLDIKPVAQDMLVRSIPDAVLVLDANRRIVEANPAANALLRSRPFREEVTQDDRVAREADGDAPAGRLLETEVTAGERTYSRTDTGLFSNSGHRVGTLIIMRDITERKRAEQKLRRSRDQYQSLVNNIPGATYQCLPDKGRTVRYMSAGIEALTGYPPGDFVNAAVRTYESIVHPSDAERVEHAITAAIQQGIPWHLEYRIVHRDGGVRWVYERGTATVDRTGDQFTLNGFVMDITQQKRDRAEADRSHRELRRLATHLQAVREEDRAAVAWELHNEIGQALAVVKMDVAAACDSLPPDAQTRAPTRLGKAA